LRVTEELQGRPVKCPACGLTFTVPAGSTEAQPAVLTPAPGQPAARAVDELGEGFYEQPEPWRSPAQAWEAEGNRRGRAKSLLLPPAICLVLASLLGLLGDLYELWAWRTAPEAQMQRLEQFCQALNLPLPFEREKTPSSMIASHAAFAALCIVIIVLAMLMMSLRWYPLAIIGSLLPMINLDSSCCCLGCPLGIWALVVLLRPEVRDAFYSRSPV